MRVQAVPVDGLGPRQGIKFIVGLRGIKQAEAHAADSGKGLAGGTGHGTIELRLVHNMPLHEREMENTRLPVTMRTRGPADAGEATADGPPGENG